MNSFRFQAVACSVLLLVLRAGSLMLNAGLPDLLFERFRRR